MDVIGVPHKKRSKRLRLTPLRICMVRPAGFERAGGAQACFLVRILVHA